MKGWMFEDIFKTYEEAEFKKDIIFKGYVNDDELGNLYQNASVFVYPSFYEGFGFPIIEAFSYGVPVVTSSTSSCGEIAGDSALSVDPSSYKDIGEAISRLINDTKLRKEFCEKGIKRARGFSWDRTAREFLKLFAQ
jgi:glycosyltransferase involved in cell wall biosynthesis